MDIDSEYFKVYVTSCHLWCNNEVIYETPKYIRSLEEFFISTLLYVI